MTASGRRLFRTGLGFAFGASLFLAGCCPGAHSLPGKTYIVHVRSDIDDTIEVSHWVQGERKRNAFWDRLVHCAGEEVREEQDDFFNAKNGRDVGVYSEDATAVIVTATYHGLTANYVADATYNVFIRASDLH